MKAGHSVRIIERVAVARLQDYNPGRSTRLWPVLQERLDFISFAAIDSVMNSRISSHSRHYQPSRGKLGERLFDSLGLPLDVLIQQPPLDDAFQCILRVGIGVQISKDLMR